jgi:hypothetical protein
MKPNRSVIITEWEKSECKQHNKSKSRDNKPTIGQEYSIRSWKQKHLSWKIPCMMNKENQFRGQ